MNIDKVMETVICKRVVEDMKSKLDPAQYANQKGLSIQHYLIAMLNKILSAVDKNSKELLSQGGVLGCPCHHGGLA